MEKFCSENYLLNVRLDSMSEILALQEVDITKVCMYGATILLRYCVCMCMPVCLCMCVCAEVWQ